MANASSRFCGGRGLGDQDLAHVSADVHEELHRFFGSIVRPEDVGDDGCIAVVARGCRAGTPGIKKDPNLTAGWSAPHDDRLRPADSRAKRQVDPYRQRTIAKTVHSRVPCLAEQANKLSFKIASCLYISCDFSASPERSLSVTSCRRLLPRETRAKTRNPRRQVSSPSRCRRIAPGATQSRVRRRYRLDRRRRSALSQS